MMDRIFHMNRLKCYFIWAIMILTGSIFTYVYPQSLETVYITWGVLILAGIGATSYFADWSSWGGRLGQGLVIIATIGLLAAQAANTYLGMFPQLEAYDRFLQWSVLASVSYIVAALIFRIRNLFVAGLFSLFLIPVFAATTLPASLVFGIAHAGILLILAF